MEVCKRWVRARVGIDGPAVVTKLRSQMRRATENRRRPMRAVIKCASRHSGCRGAAGGVGKVAPAAALEIDDPRAGGSGVGGVAVVDPRRGPIETDGAAPPGLGFVEHVDRHFIRRDAGVSFIRRMNRVIAHSLPSLCLDLAAGIRGYCVPDLRFPASEVSLRTPPAVHNAIPRRDCDRARSSFAENDSTSSYHPCCRTPGGMG